ncbi:hypothetical protein DACRYDRAFT_21082 [Dacryopinax primogenitus]|uniref:CRAL-TRIO domain-containing protein n=1 Tax=Dacryopinax primogenitus (strain DJM 731) TaxID=1858805 RepID=M5FZS4_DACPD|nr:uncharacterized protein DACRYDRAFT_21082 [Dacryopinax primogenitus]EJU03521.1 hypothetical protein DACRYDRAFT_21082 [Dacryopinax primogenitus]
MRGEFNIEDELQNSITREFKQNDWKALIELRDQLPHILEEAFPNEEKVGLLPFNIWGVTTDPLEPSAKASVVLMHFLRKRKVNVKAAGKLLVETLRWRAEVRPEEIAKEEFDELSFGKIGNLFGKDNQGRPVLYMRMGRDAELMKVYDDPAKYVRWRIGLMERTCLAVDYETTHQVVSVMDFRNFRTDNHPGKKKVEEEIQKILPFYPGMGCELFLLYTVTPTLLKVLFWVILRPWTTAVKHMHVLGDSPSAIAAGMLPFIPASELPKPYGGTAEPKWCTGPGWEVGSRP